MLNVQSNLVLVEGLMKIIHYHLDTKSLQILISNYQAASSYNMHHLPKSKRGCRFGQPLNLIRIHYLVVYERHVNLHERIYLNRDSCIIRVGRPVRDTIQEICEAIRTEETSMRCIGEGPIRVQH